MTKEFSKFNGYHVKDAKAREMIKETAFSQVLQVANDEELKNFTVPTLAVYNNWDEPMLPYNNMNTLGFLCFNAPFMQYQFAVTGHTSKPTILMRKVDLEVHESTEWEFINPPMELNVEYRTTERFNGKPVYKMCMQGIASADNLTLSFHPSTVTEEENHVIIDYNGHDSDWYPLDCESRNVSAIKRSDVSKTNYLEVTCFTATTLTVEISYIKMDE